MKTTVAFRASHPHMDRESIRLYFDLGEEFVLLPLPRGASENWRNTVLNHMCCWDFSLEGGHLTDDPLFEVYEVLLKEKEKLIPFVKGGGRTEIWLDSAVDKSWGSEITPGLMVALGRLGMVLCLHVFLSNDPLEA